MKKAMLLAAAASVLGAAPALAEEGGAAAGPLVVNGGLMIWTLVIFGILLAVLRKFAWPVVLGAVRDREKALEEQIAAAERNRAESARILEEHKQLLAEARTSAHALISEAKGMAEKERTVALEKTRAEQEELLARARREIGVERDRAVQELRREAVDLSLAAAGRLIGQRLESDADRNLVMSYLDTLEPSR
ncbi:MAG TPA: F0F1 ATP synthase subunit B [Gemmatimonadales bacterium]|jgi:F-type H+-transporting ATPase subunit b|nr:F0F1 ATP synthase subunit B [Gemmatimonadales bacterium]